MTSYRSRILWIEILVWIAIVLTIVTFLARIFYWQYIRNAEDDFCAWLGISPGVHEVLKGVAALLGLSYVFIRYGIFRKRT